MAHYVDNKEFLAAMIEYRKLVKEAADAGDPKPRVPNYIGECILKIATHLAYKPNFINYSYRDEMVSDGIENCLQYIDNFNPEKSSNPFAYFTQIIYYAFLRRITREKKQAYIKGKMIQEMPMDVLETHAFADDDQEFKNSYIEFMQNHQVLDDSFLKKKEKKKKKTDHVSLDTFIEGEENEDEKGE